VSDASFLSIGEVLQLLQEEFPDVTISKIRFLESQGLIDPERTPSGYRKFYEADIERLKFILREQKDSYLPLKVIKNRLDAGESTGPVIRPVAVADADATAAAGAVATGHDATGHDATGHDALDVGRSARATSSAHAANGARETATSGTTAGSVEDGHLDAPTPAAAAAPQATRTTVDAAVPDAELDVAAPSGTAVTFEELVGATSLTPAQLREVERYGLLVGRPVGRTTYYDDDAVEIARLVAGFLRYGIEPRHLRMYRNSAEREAGVFEQVILPLVKQRNPAARTQALDALNDLSGLGAGFREAMVRQALRGYTESL